MQCQGFRPMGPMNAGPGATNMPRWVYLRFQWGLVPIHFVFQWSYVFLLREGVPKEPSLEDIAVDITKHYIAPEGQWAWPFMDLVEVEGGYRIASDVSIGERDLANIHRLHNSLRANDELFATLTTLVRISIEISKTKVAEAIVRGILKSRQGEITEVPSCFLSGLTENSTQGVNLAELSTRSWDEEHEGSTHGRVGFISTVRVLRREIVTVCSGTGKQYTNSVSYRT